MQRYKLPKMKRIHGVHFAPDGRRLLAVGGDEARMVDSAVLLDLDAGTAVHRLDRFAQCYAVTADLSRYALGGGHHYADYADSADAPPLVWTDPRADDWRPLPCPPGRGGGPQGGEIHALAFAADGRLAAARLDERLDGRDRTWVYDLVVVPPGARCATAVPIEDFGGLLAFRPDGEQLALGGGLDYEPQLVVLDPATGQTVYKYKPPGSRTRGLAYSPDGSHLAVANARNVFVLPADGPTPVLTLAVAAKQVNAVAYSPDGAKLLTAAHDGAIRVWDAHSGKPLAAFDWKVGAVTAVAFAPDGLTAAAAGLGGKVVVWDVDV
jgi:WD40 repeat protein